MGTIIVIWGCLAVAEIVVMGVASERIVAHSACLFPLFPLLSLSLSLSLSLCLSLSPLSLSLSHSLSLGASTIHSFQVAQTLPWARLAKAVRERTRARERDTRERQRERHQRERERERERELSGVVVLVYDPAGHSQEILQALARNCPKKCPRSVRAEKNAKLSFLWPKRPVRGPLFDSQNQPRKTWVGAKKFMLKKFMCFFCPLECFGHLAWIPQSSLAHECFLGVWGVSELLKKHFAVSCSGTQSQVAKGTPRALCSRPVPLRTPVQ